MFSKKDVIVMSIIALSASTLSTPVLPSASSPCGSPVTVYTTVTPTVTSVISSGSLKNSTTPQNSPSITLSTSPVNSSISLPVTTGLTLDCHENNCLRQFIKAPEIPSFCAIYTKTINTVTTGLPDYVSMCDASPSQISSACSCVGATPTVSSIPTTTSLDCQENNCLRQFLNPTNTQVTPFCNAYTTAVNTASAGLPTFVDMCDGEPSQVSSACSCAVTPSVTSFPTSSFASFGNSSLPASTSAPFIHSISSANLVNATSTADGMWGTKPFPTANSSFCPSAKVIYSITTATEFITITGSLPTSSFSLV